MTTFNYEIIKETEKAVFAKIPFFEKTSDVKSKHKQLFYECWIPKTILDSGRAKEFVIGKRNEIRLSNPYQKRCIMPISWNTIGEYAPTKDMSSREEVDFDRLKELISFYEHKYGASLRRLSIDEEGTNGYVSDDDIKIITALEFPSLKNEYTPKKITTFYI